MSGSAVITEDPRSTTAGSLWPGDRVGLFVVASAGILSVGATVITAWGGATLAYPDAVSHLLITRRVLDGSTPGAAQLGGVWLPLPHLLATAFVWPDAWYYSGLGACVVSMFSFVAATGWLYRTARSITGTSSAGLVAAVVFATNPNVLYLQSTPMTEIPLFAAIAAAVDYLTRWYRTGDFRCLIAAGTATLLATLIRYEGWVLCAVFLLLVARGSWVRHRAAHSGEVWVRVRAEVFLFGCLAVSGILGWLTWNGIILGDPLNFLRGEFARPELWVAEEKAAGDWSTALGSYLYAVVNVLGLPTLVTGIGGLAYLAWRTRPRGAVLPLLGVTVLLPFFVYALYSGQRPLHVRQIHGDLYNVRFGLVLIVPLAVGVGLVVPLLQSWIRNRRVSAVILPSAAVLASVLVGTGGIATLQESRTFLMSETERRNAAAASWLRANYDHGRILMQSWNNETVMFGSRIRTRNVIYEGSYQLWERALADPARSGIRWIHLGRSDGVEDDVWRSLRDSPRLHDSYTLVYQDSARKVYLRSGDTIHDPENGEHTPAAESEHTGPGVRPKHRQDGGA